MVDLVLDGVSVTFAHKTILHPTSARLCAGQLTAIVGANGAGKSSLLKAIAALVPATGTVSMDGKIVSLMGPAARARYIGYLPQHHEFAWPIPVADMVALGLFAFGGMASASAKARVTEMLDQCGIAALADRGVDTLSGGERALAALARVLIADTPAILVDEPAAALDIGRQYQMLEQLSALAASGRTVVAVLHDVALAAQFADRILWLDGGIMQAFTDTSRAAIDAHAPRLLGRTPLWTEATVTRPATPYFAR